ncbi:MAG: serine/threonine-protein kinase [Kofleriaceae bacterium]
MSTLSDAPWGQTLAAYGQRAWSGTLTVDSDDRSFSVSFDRGAVIDASSPLATDAAVRVALIGQLISSTKVSEIVRRHAAEPTRSELDVIVELGKLSADQGIQLRRRVVARRAARTFSLERGEIHAVDATAAGIPPPFSQLDVREVIYLGARENLSAPRLMDEIDRQGSWFMLKPSAIEELPRFGFGEDAHPIVDLLCEGAALSELESCKPGLDRRVVWSVLYALIVSDACEVGDAARALRRERDADMLKETGGELAPVRRIEAGELAPVRKSTPARPMITDLVGVTLGNRYVIEQKLGVGSAGVVYRAHHTKLTRLFALKVLHRGLLAEAKAVQRFEREAQLAGALTHPNVVSVVDVGTHDGVPYLAMEHAEGASLASLILEGPMQPARVINLLRQLCLGLAHAHERGMIHRDLKPENVIVEAAGTVETPRIADFALAILRETGGSERLTAAGVVLGTPAYMAPEHTSGAVMDHRVDLYALGVISYQLLTGVLPFAGSNVEIALASLRDAPPVMAARVPGLVVDPLLEALTRALLEKTPEARPRDANEVRELLDLIETDRDAAAARFGIVPKHPSTIAMWKLPRDAAAPPAPPVEPLLAPPIAQVAPAPFVHRSKSRMDGSGTVSSLLRTEAMPPIQAKPKWPIFAIVVGIVIVVIVVLALSA